MIQNTITFLLTAISFLLAIYAMIDLEQLRAMTEGDPSSRVQTTRKWLQAVYQTIMELKEENRRLREVCAGQGSADYDMMRRVYEQEEELRRRT